MNRTTKILALMLAIVMICSAIAACGNGGNITTTEKPSVDSTEATTAAPTEKPTEKPTEETSEATTNTPSEKDTEETTEENTEIVVVESPHDELIQTANGLANGVQGRYTDNMWRAYDIMNQNMTLRYNLPHDREQKVVYIKNTQGKSYIENTMDVFVKMTNGYTVYASASSDDTLLNIYRFGYYYNDFRFQEQNFLDDLEILAEIPVDITKQSYLEGIGRPTKNDDGSITFNIKAPYDPFIIFSENLDIDSDQYKYVRVTMKTTDVEQCTLYYIAGSQTRFNANQLVGFNTIPDGEWHTYYIRVLDEDSNAGVFKGIRLDFDKFKEIKKDIHIKDISFVEAERNGISDIELENVFHTYSDKLHHEVHIATYKEVTDVAEIGVETVIAADTVAKLIVKDKNGTHDTLDTVDWASVECVGFDIIDAGIFGFILPDHEYAGNMSITLEDGKYVIIYSRAPENNTLVAVEGTPESKPGTVRGNSEDFRLGQRIYTDETHSFDDLLLQTELERNPLGGKNIKVSAAYSANASYLGYDPIRGCYRFWIGYNKLSRFYPNRYFNLQFTVKSDDTKRLIYVMAENDAGGSPYVALLDDNLMALPIPIEIGNNFVGDKDDTLFDVLDAIYQEATAPIIVPTDKAVTYNLIMSYYAWGDAEIKQLSSIQFHAPYYRTVTGGTETNCMVPWKYTRTPAVPNRLPDHRAISAPEWPGNIDHTQGGSHSFGNKDATDLVEQTVLSYGPTYSDLEMVYAGNDYTITYHHIEMPQRDENRTYYTIDFNFTNKTTINFKTDFSFYSVGSFESTEDYKQFGYLDANNEGQIVKFADMKDIVGYYPLGYKPYIDAFELNNVTVASYCNVSCLVNDYEVIINGEKVDVGLLLRATKNNGSVALTLDVDKLTFNEGDTISINIILIPWGSEQTDYSNTIYPADQNIRDVREDSLINQIKLVPGANCELVENDWVPMGKSTNGKSAEFTITGGKVSEYTIPNRDTGWRAEDGQKMAVRIYGFARLGVPVVEQFIDGEWVTLDISSSDNLDDGGHGAYFDGYGVYYDEDGTYSYSIIVDMNDAQDKTYRMSIREDFEKFGWIIVDDASLEVKNPFKVYYDATKFAGKTFKGWFGRITQNDQDGVSYISYNPLPVGHRYNESQAEIFSNPNMDVTGQYVVLKYRIPAENENNDKMRFEFYLSTDHDRNGIKDPADRIDATIDGGQLIADGQWHLLVIDISAFGQGWSMVPNANGEYIIQYIRFDMFNGLMSPKSGFVDQVDISDFAIHDNLDDIKEFFKSSVDDYILVDSNGSARIDIETGDYLDMPEPPTPGGDSSVDLKLFYDAKEFASHVSTAWIDHLETKTEDEISFTSLYAHGTHGESQLSGILQNNTSETGQFVVIKYRIPKAYDGQEVTLEFFTSTVNSKATGADTFSLTNSTAPADGEWHVIVVDTTTFGKGESIAPNENGQYVLKHVRFDAINGTTDTSYRVDIAYFAIHNNLDEILEFASTTGDSNVIFVTGNGAEDMSTAK